jgi:hypothetical protein
MIHEFINRHIERAIHKNTQRHAYFLLIVVCLFEKLSFLHHYQEFNRIRACLRLLFFIYRVKRSHSKKWFGRWVRMLYTLFSIILTPEEDNNNNREDQPPKGIGSTAEMKWIPLPCLSHS